MARTIRTPLSLPFSPIPLPWFSKSFTEYSLMSAYGSMVGAVTTTTTSPVFSLSARDMRSIASAFCESMTFAKSLTGSVSSGSCCAAMVRPSPDTSRKTISQRLTRMAAPLIHVRHELFDRVEIGGEEPLGIGRRDFTDLRERDDVADAAARHAEQALAVAGDGGRIVRRL